MGEMVEIKCPACEWNIEGDLGVGMLSFQEWETIDKYSASKWELSIQRKLDSVGVTGASVFREHVIAVCENCQRFGFRENYEVSHSHGKITPSFKCTNCNCTMHPIDDHDDFITKKAKCPKCGSGGLNMYNFGMWD
ncbi:hypothetical protein N9X39_00590 [Alphaproteobacteria bacterium]|nr:hypothetical protein [Alphaproteobacteria bacterium]